MTLMTFPHWSRKEVSRRARLLGTTQKRSSRIMYFSPGCKGQREVIPSAEGLKLSGSLHDPPGHMASRSAGRDSAPWAYR
eukprot:14424941-Heterocapsa_arctica.AAC.1